MIIGIDLGTTNSLVSYFTEEGPKIIKNRLGENLTPSVVSVDEEGQVYIGRTALERKQLYPFTCASVFKRSMGTDKEYVLSGKRFKADELSSLVLRSLKEDAENFLGEQVTEAVISVPAYFNDEQRKATKRAGELAGLKVERMISEPTAAAIAYGLHKKSMGTKFLVFDLGGGTFDVSVIELFQNIMEVRAVAGDNYLGGEDFTNCLLELFCEKTDIDAGELDAKEKEKLEYISERAKKEFTEENEVNMRFKLKGELKEARICEAEYEKACQNLLAGLKKPIERSLSDANIKVKDIDEIVLVGGSTKMPIVRRFVSRLFGRFPNVSINPDEAVALGAALQGAMKERNELIKEMIMTDVCPFTLGTEVVSGKNGYLENGHFLPIIERNTVIPVSRTERVCTASDNQEKIRINILQGESRLAKNNLLLGTLETTVPKNKAGEEEIDITYTYDINSILEVEATVISTGKKSRLVLKKDDCVLSDEEIDKRFKELAALKIHPRDQEENKLLLLKGERLYEECTGQMRNIIDAALSAFERALEKQNEQEIGSAREELKLVIAEAERTKWDD